MPDDFDLTDFLPYVLNRASEAAGHEFQAVYKERYGMLRSEWRVLFHLGRFGDLTSREVCDRSGLHKTKVSRAVKALEQKRYLTRTAVETDRRQETLRLTATGQSVYRDLKAKAQDFDAAMASRVPAEDLVVLRRCLKEMSGLS